MKALPQISEAEFEVMSPKTIQTLIKRLMTKGALSYEKQSRVFVYTPLVDEFGRLKNTSISPIETIRNEAAAQSQPNTANWRNDFSISVSRKIPAASNCPYVPCLFA